MPVIRATADHPGFRFHAGNSTKDLHLLPWSTARCSAKRLGFHGFRVIRRLTSDVRPCKSVTGPDLIDGMVISNATPISTLTPAPPMVGETGEWAIAAASERLRVLLIDDDPGEARLTLEKLRDAGDSVDCQVATTFQEVSVDRLDGIQCVLIEPGGPDATRRALQTLRARAPELPVVVLTRIEEPDTAARSLRLGAQEYLVKTHADGHAMSRAIRFAVVRERLQAARRRQTEHDLELHDDVIQALFAIGLAMQTTLQRAASEPALAARINDHVNGLHEVLQLVRSTIIDG